jgi:hypothetical protein
MISEASFFLHVLHSYHKSRLGTSLRILALCWLACISKTAQVISKVVGVLLNQKRVLVTHVFGGSWIFVNFFREFMFVSNNVRYSWSS